MTELLARRPSPPSRRSLEQWARPTVAIAGRVRSSFRVCGYLGMALAVPLGLGLASRLGLSPWVVGLIALVALGTCLILAMAAKILLGDERLVLYHHKIALLAAVTLMLWATGQPVLAYLDVTILGVGAFLVCGRLGCFMVGCCHGRPHPIGIRYGPQHAVAGFSCNLVGVCVFPVQLVEAAWALLTVAGGVRLLLAGATPGQVLAWFVVAYGAGRFALEFARGDAKRTHVAGFSEAQWTSLLLMLAVVAAGVGGVLPLQVGHVATPAGVALVMLGVAARRSADPAARHRLLHPSHIDEVAGALRLLLGAAATGSQPERSRMVVDVVRTSQGIALSTGVVETADGPVRHYGLSRTGAPLHASEAWVLADLLALLIDRTAAVELLPGPEGVFHCLIPEH